MYQEESCKRFVAIQMVSCGKYGNVPRQSEEPNHKQESRHRHERDTCVQHDNCKQLEIYGD